MVIEFSVRATTRSMPIDQLAKAAEEDAESPDATPALLTAALS
jgi:hypothetical protein